MTDLRKAAEMALAALEVATTPLAKDRQEVIAAQKALRQALAQPQQEPVAWMYPSDLKAFETAEATATATAFSIKVGCTDQVSVPLYTAPPIKLDVNQELVEALKQAEESLAAFVSDHGWSARDMDIFDNVSAALAKHKEQA